MKAPETIPAEFFAPCGINCMLCSRQFEKKRPPCHGCLRGGSSTCTHSETCRIKLCAFERGLSHCFECDKFPCSRIRRLEKRYRENCGYLLLEAAETARSGGVEVLLEQQLAHYSCGCGGLICLQSGVCSEFGKRHFDKDSAAGAKR
jgi:hypothetical protein